MGFAVGTGRCGTKFVAEAVGLEPDVSSVHERNTLNENFHRYCKWYGLPVDDEGFLRTKEIEIRRDLKSHIFSFEASAPLSFSIRELYDRFGAKFILLVRNPGQVVNSLMRKGVYERPVVRGDPCLALGYQESRFFHHFLGRIVPSGEKFLKWSQMSRVGKLAWWWSEINARILEQLESIPETDWRVEKIEEMDYSRYLDVVQFLGLEATIPEQAYNELAGSRPNALPRVQTMATWTPSEIGEFEEEVAPTARKLGYEYRVDCLFVPEASRPVKPIYSEGMAVRSTSLAHAGKWWWKILLKLLEMSD